MTQPQNINQEIQYQNDSVMILMPAHAPHALKATESFKMMLTMIKS